MKTLRMTLAVSLFCIAAVQAREPIQMDFKVSDMDRQAMIYPPVTEEKAKTAKGKTVPVVFCFHGHGGGSSQAAKSFKMHEAWPEALVVYPQGVPTPGQLTDAAGKREGWQAKFGDHGDRDLKFFDVMLKELAKIYLIDSNRVFVMGHSNGGGFTYLLWAHRGDKITAVAPCASLSMQVVGQLKPKPCLHIAARGDRLVKFSWQERMMSEVKRINGCQEKGEAWAPDCLLYKPVNKKVGAPMVQYIHDGTHRYPDQATAMMVKFFKEME